MKDNLQRKTILDGRQPSMQDDLWREKTELAKLKIKSCYILKFPNPRRTFLVLEWNPDDFGWQDAIGKYDGI